MFTSNKYKLCIYVFAIVSAIITVWGLKAFLENKQIYYGKDLYTKGHFVVDGNSIKTDNTPNGVFSYGPYAKLDKGSYKIVLDYQLSKGGKASFDVVTDIGNNCLYKAPLSPDKSKVAVNVELDKLSKLEVRTFYEGRGILTVEKVTIIPIPLLKHYDFLLAISLFALFFWFYFKLFAWLVKLKWVQNNSRIEILFLAVFFTFLFIPMSNISDAEKSSQENRMLAKFPSLYVNGQLNKAYGTDFEKWFNDRFAGRNLLINLYNRINALFNDKIDAEKVFQGQDEWLFYKGGGSIDNFQNAVLFKDKDLKNIASYLQNINDWSEKNNKKFYFIIAPDKNKIYGEYFPKMRKKRPDSQSRANQLINYLQKHTDVKVLYLYDVLMNNKDKGLLYYKNDTHWNALGAYYGYQEIINLIRSDFNNIPEVEIEGYKKTPHLKGDLTMMYPEPLQKEDNTQYNVPQFTDRMLCNPKQFASRSLVTCENRDLLLRAVVFRDSFTNILIPYFGQSFRKTQYIWRYDVRAEDVNFMQESDVILLIMVERSIVNLAGLKFNFNN